MDRASNRGLVTESDLVLDDDVNGCAEELVGQLDTGLTMMLENKRGLLVVVEGLSLSRIRRL